MAVILSHLGYGSGPDPLGHAGAERGTGERDTALAEAAARLTDRTVLILGGHSHTDLNVDGIEGRNLIAGRVPTAQAEARGAPSER